MAAGGRQQINVLNTSIRKLAGRFNANDPSPYLVCFATLAADGVCPRCLLRLAGHTNFEDYALPAPPHSQVMSVLDPDRELATANGAGSSGDAATTVDDASEPCCPTCFGLLQSLLEDAPRHIRLGNSSEPSAAAAAPGGVQGDGSASTAAVAPLAAAAPTGGAGVDVAWLRIQQRALPGAAGCRTGPAAGHERLPGLASATTLAEAVRRQAERGTPDTVELSGAAVAAAAAAEAAAGPSPDTDATMTDGDKGAAGATAAAAAAAAASDLQVPAEGLGPPLPLRSFAVEVPCVPASSAVRDVAAYVHLATAFDSRKVFYPGWRFVEVVPLAAVLRRALPLVLSRQLGVPTAAPQSADLTVSVAVLDGPVGLAEVRVLLEDQAAKLANRNTNPQQQNSQQQQQQQRHGNKRQRGNQQQKPWQRGRGGGGGGGGGGEAAQEGGRESSAPEQPPQPPQPGKVPVVSEERVRSMTLDQAGHAVAGMPRHVVNRLFPWPPPVSERPLPAPPATAPTPATAASAPADAASEANQHPAPTVSAAEQPPPPPAASTSAPQEGGLGLLGLHAGWAGPLVHVRATRRPLLLAGRYCKLRRHMPQCPWFVLATGERIGGTSVQEAIEAFVLPLYGTASAKMITGGREDADVRMLGPGRPFVLEVLAPLRGHPPAETLRRLEERMANSKCGVTVRGLAPCKPDALDAIKAAEDSKEKTYRALCWAAAPVAAGHLAALEALGRVEVAQDTPVRVLHRRAAKVRPKWLQVEKATPVAGQPHYFVLQLRTQAGTYVKEFCHGDFGRCTPSLGELLGRIRAGTAATGPAAAAAAAEGAAAAATAVEPAVGAEPAAGAVVGAGERSTDAAAAGDSGAAAAGYEHVEIVQLDVMDVHLEDWP